MTDWISAVIVDDTDENIIIPASYLKKEKKEKVIKEKKEKVIKEKVVKEKVVKEKKEKVVKEKKEKVIKEKPVKEEEPEVKIIPTCLLTKFYNSDPTIIEVGADEAGRGPMFGSV